MKNTSDWALEIALDTVKGQIILNHPEYAEHIHRLKLSNPEVKEATINWLKENKLPELGINWNRSGIKVKAQ